MYESGYWMSAPFKPLEQNFNNHVKCIDQNGLFKKWAFELHCS